MLASVFLVLYFIHACASVLEVAYLAWEYIINQELLKQHHR